MHVYEVIKRPVITEKSYDAADFNNQYTFEVDTRANKHQIMQMRRHLENGALVEKNRRGEGEERRDETKR